jgi:hypothetical protein
LLLTGNQLRPLIGAQDSIRILDANCHKIFKENIV